VALQSLRPIYATFSVPQQELSRLHPGAAVQLTASGAESAGRITAVDSVVDPATRNVQIQATFATRTVSSAPHVRRDPGGFGGEPDGRRAPRLGDQLRAVRRFRLRRRRRQRPDGKTLPRCAPAVRQAGRHPRDQVAVLSGLHPGEEVATSGVFKLRNGAAVQVNNQVQPANNPAPRPEDS